VAGSGRRVEEPCAGDALGVERVRGAIRKPIRMEARERPELVLNPPGHYEAEGKHNQGDREHHGRIGH
jgi:hypothetical protein